MSVGKGLVKGGMQIITSKIVLLYKSFLEGFLDYHKETRYKQVYTGHILSGATVFMSDFIQNQIKRDR